MTSPAAHLFLGLLAGIVLGLLGAWLAWHRRMEAVRMDAEAGIRERQRAEVALRAWRQEALCLRALLDGRCDPTHPRECRCLGAVIGRPAAPAQRIQQAVSAPPEDAQVLARAIGRSTQRIQKLEEAHGAR